MYQQDEDDEESDCRSFPRPWPQPLNAAVFPETPSNWLIAGQLGPWSDGTHVAIWVRLLQTFQPYSTARQKRHMVCHGFSGHRYLMIHPDLLETARWVADRINCDIEDCCGGTCIAPGIDDAANWVFANRKWQRMPFPQRLEIATEFGITDMAFVMSGRLDDYDGDEYGELLAELVS